MQPRQSCKATGVWMLGLALLCTQSGCLSFVHPLHPPAPDELLPCKEIAPCQKNQVYIFFVHGLDPFDLSNYEGLHAYVQSLGFIKTYYGWSYHAFYFEKELRKLREEKPEARIVLIGFSYGAGMVRDIACSVRSAGIDIDLIMYLDGVEWDKRPLHRPANVHRVVNILSHTRTDKRNVIEGENHRFEDAYHFKTVSHPQTLRLVAQELCAVAAQVPIVQRLPDLPPPNEQLPPPKEGAPMLPAPKEVPQASSEWDFLLPDPFAQGVPGAKPAAQAFATPADPSARSN